MPDGGSPGSIEAAIGQAIHQWTPHTNLALTGVSIVVFILAMMVAAARRGPRALGLDDLARVGFAAGPLPIYFLLPLAPYDRDLAGVLLDQPFQMLIAAVVGIIWTVADIRKITRP